MNPTVSVAVSLHSPHSKVMIWDSGPRHISQIWTGFIPGAELVWGGVGSGQDDQLCLHLSPGKSQVLLTLSA